MVLPLVLRLRVGLKRPSSLTTDQRRLPALLWLSPPWPTFCRFLLPYQSPPPRLLPGSRRQWMLFCAADDDLDAILLRLVLPLPRLGHVTTRRARKMSLQVPRSLSMHPVATCSSCGPWFCTIILRSVCLRAFWPSFMLLPRLLLLLHARLLLFRRPVLPSLSVTGA